jgi:hypothetical protein
VKVLRRVGAGLVWLVASVVGSLGVLLSLTIILLPLGVPLLMLARRLFGLSARLMLPRSVVHPVKELQRRTTTGPSRAIDRGRRTVARATGRRPPTMRTRMRKRARRLGKRLGVA